MNRASEFLTKRIPLVATVRSYSRRDFRGDLHAGLTTAIMLVPQAMGYAMLAGLPPIHGLYASLLPLVVYALLGSCRQLSVGPVAMDSLLVATGVGTVAAAGSSQYTAYAILLACMVGCLQVMMGLSRLGFLVNFLSRPIISGFTSAAALIIASSQLKHLLGIPLDKSNNVFDVVAETVSRVQEISLITLSIAMGSIVVLVLLKRFASSFPRALTVVIAGSLLVWMMHLEGTGIAVVGIVPQGLPQLRAPHFDGSVVARLFPIALTIALVAFMESIAVGKKYADLNKYQIDANQELVAIGCANIAGSFSQGYPVTGGFSRTAVNAQAGARTNIAALVTASMVALTLMFLTPLFYYLPKAVLAAIIVVAVIGLIDLQEVMHLWRVKRSDLSMLVLTFFATLLLGIKEGILVGVFASLALMVFHTTRPHIAVLGRLPNTEVFRNVLRFKEAQTEPGILVIRLDGQFYFGNVNFLKEKLTSLEQRQAIPLRAVILDASGVNRIDASGEAALREILEDYRTRSIRFVLANVKGPVRDVLRRSGFFDEIGYDSVFMRVEDAMSLLCTGHATAEYPSSIWPHAATQAQEQDK